MSRFMLYAFTRQFKHTMTIIMHVLQYLVHGSKLKMNYISLQAPQEESVVKFLLHGIQLDPIRASSS